jgi:hypothetical protein
MARPNVHQYEFDDDIWSASDLMKEVTFLRGIVTTLQNMREQSRNEYNAQTNLLLARDAQIVELRQQLESANTQIATFVGLLRRARDDIAWRDAELQRLHRPEPAARARARLAPFPDPTQPQIRQREPSTTDEDAG